MQAAMKTHLSQSSGAGAFDGQQGISLAISSIIADGELSSAEAGADTSATDPDMAGRESGANARPTTTRIVRKRRMVGMAYTRFDLIRRAT